MEIILQPEKLGFISLADAKKLAPNNAEKEVFLADLEVLDFLKYRGKKYVRQIDVQKII